MNNKKNTPDIRFAGFTEPWEERKLGEIAPLQRGFDLPINDMVTGIYPVVMSNGINGYHSEFKARAPGVITGRSGTIGNVIFIEKDYWPHNTTLWVTDFKDNVPEFIFYLYKNLNLNRFSTGSGVPTLNRNDIHTIFISIPKSTQEQSRIGNFFRSLDRLITLRQQKYDKLVTVKKSLLGKMFPKEGETVPELRFAGFSGNWEERKLGEIAECYSGGTPSAGNSEYYGGVIPFIRSGEINSNSTELFLTEEGLQNSSAKEVKKGDILYALYGATSGEVGISHINGAINQAILAIEPKQNYNSHFLAYWLRKQKHSIISTYLQGGQGNLSGNIVKDLIVTLPKNTQEQTVIGNFFKSLDNLITLQSKELEKLKNIKKSLLDKMFV